MAQNKSIMIKIKEHTEQNSEMRNFLGDIFQFESKSKNGWYDKKYNELIETYFDKESGDIKNENM